MIMVGKKELVITQSHRYVAQAGTLVLPMPAFFYVAAALKDAHLF